MPDSEAASGGEIRIAQMRVTAHLSELTAEGSPQLEARFGLLDRWEVVEKTHRTKPERYSYRLSWEPSTLPLAVVASGDRVDLSVDWMPYDNPGDPDRTVVAAQFIADASAWLATIQSASRLSFSTVWTAFPADADQGGALVKALVPEASALPIGSDFALAFGRQRSLPMGEPLDVVLFEQYRLTTGLVPRFEAEPGPELLVIQSIDYGTPPDIDLSAGGIALPDLFASLVRLQRQDGKNHGLWD